MTDRVADARAGSAPVLALVACRYGDPDVERILEEIQAEYVRRYGGPDATPLEPEDFDLPTGTFLLVYHVDQPVDGVHDKAGESTSSCASGVRDPVGNAGPAPREPVGSAAFRRHDDVTAEIKRMYLRPDLRGTGVAQLLLAEIEQRAAGAGYRRLVLETAEQSPEAVRLYEKSGYTPIEPYGYYRCSPSSRCFAKDL